MRKKLTWIVLLSFVVAVSGCASKEVQQQYYDLEDRKSTRLNSSHTVNSYAVFCLKKKKQPIRERKNETYHKNYQINNERS